MICKATENHCCSFSTKVLFFSNKCCFFVNFSIFAWIKLNICCWKTTFLLQTSNNNAMLLTATNIASGAYDDNRSQNPFEILRFPKNLDFWQFLKIEFELHICCHDYDLSNIKNWQHIGGGLCCNKLATNLCLPTAPQFNFHLRCRFFSHFDKINNFWQQKQLVLFLSNMTPKVLLT